jgi:hypothetical protein
MRWKRQIAQGQIDPAEARSRHQNARQFAPAWVDTMRGGRGAIEVDVDVKGVHSLCLMTIF